MSTLMLLRHAKSSWELDLEDRDRPLATRGRRDALAAGRLLAERGLRADLVLCSSAARTRQTWERAVAGGAEAGEVRYLDEIYQAAAGDLLRLVRQVEDVGSLLVVGHAPSIPDLAEQLTARERDSAASLVMRAKYPTSGLAVLAVVQPWATIDSAHLLTFVVPRG